MRRYLKQKGTTLVELLIASMILVVAFGGLCSSLAATVFIIDTARDETQAITDLRNIMERIRSTPLSNVVSLFPHNVANGPGSNPYSAIVGGFQLTAEAITISYQDPNTDPLEIYAQVQWQDRRGTLRNMVLSTAKTR